MVLEVGKKYASLMGLEGTMLNFTGSGFTLKIMYNGPTKREIENITKGKVQYKVVYLKNVIILLVKFGDEMWMDVPLFGDEDTFEYIEKITDKDSGYALNILVSEARTGELKGIRVLAINNSVSRNIYKFLENQKERGYEQEDYDLALGQIYENYPTSQLVKMAVASGKVN